MISNLNVLTGNRSAYLSRFSRDEVSQIAKIEAKFGGCLMLPLDVPLIKAADDAKFIDWYNTYSLPIRKIGVDVAGGTSANVQTFKAIDSEAARFNPVWETNARSDFLPMFPEIASALKALPFDAEAARYSLWSSNIPIGLHRDQGAWEDFPGSFRVMLYDSNPTSTLGVVEATADTSKKTLDDLIVLPRYEGNTYAWNNLRTVHGSHHHDGYQKVLLIFTKVKYDYDALEDLFERSVKKYKDLVAFSKFDRSAFVKN